MIWNESYESQGLHDWLFAQHRLTPGAIQFSAPTNYPTWSGISTIEWTASDPNDSAEIWFSPDHGQTWALLESGIPNSGSYAFDTQAFGDTPFGLVRILLIGEDGLAYARQRSTPFRINNGTSSDPVIQLQDFSFRDRIDSNLEFIEGLVVTDSTLTVGFRAGDPDTPSLDAALLYSPDGGISFEMVDAFSHVTSGDLRSLVVDMVTLPNTPRAQLRVDVSDGVSTVSAMTPVFAKETPRITSSLLEHVQGNGRPVILINFVDPEVLTNHRYRIDFSVSESATKNGNTNALVKTYAVTDLDLGAQIFSGFPVSGQEGPLFDGIRLLIQDAPKGIESELTGWISGDTDQQVTISAESPSLGELLATPDDYRITITENVADTSKALLGFTARPMRFTVESVTAGESRDVLFADRGDGIPSNLDRIYILEEDDSGALSPAWHLSFGTRTIAPEPGDVFEMITQKPISDGEAFEFIGALGVGTQDEGSTEGFELAQNYPNPFSRTTTIPYRLESPADVELTVFDALGRRVAVLVSGQQSAGEHRVDWDATQMPSGAYFYRLNAGGRRLSRMLLLLK